MLRHGVSYKESIGEKRVPAKIAAKLYSLDSPQSAVRPPREPGLATFEGHYDEAKRQGYIYMVDVADPGRGIGTRAVRNFEDWVAGQGGTEVVGDALPGSRGFWERLGYDVAKRPHELGPGGRKVYKIRKALRKTAAEGTLYHGTSSKGWQKIADNGGVMDAPSYWGTEAVAEYYAGEAAEADDSEDIKIVSMPLSAFDRGKLAPDGNSIAEPLTYTLGRGEEELYAEWEASAGTWQDCLRIYGSVRYDAPVRVR